MIIKRYILRTVAESILLVTFFLVALQFFILLVNELDDIGTGGYSIFDALTYVSLRVPYEVYNFFPIACLLGSLVGLGVLSSSNELVVARIAGLSKSQMMLTVLKLGLGILIAQSIIGEEWVPKLLAHAESQKILLKSGGQAIKTQYGLWLRDGKNFVYVTKATSDHSLYGVMQYRFDDKGKLIVARAIDKATFGKKGWLLHQVKTSHISDNKVSVTKDKLLPWELNISPQRVSISDKEIDEMSLRQLWQYITIQKKASMSTAAHEINFWYRVFQPLSAVVMMMLALPFIFGSLRDKTMGYRVMMGALAGFSFYILNRLMMSVGLIYLLSPFWITLAPTLLFMLVTVALLIRQEGKVQ